MDEEHAAGLAANPPGLRFEIRFADGRSRFVQGEPIAVALSFSSSLPGTYELDGGLYDRSGRLSLDEYVLEPDDVPDPLADYFERGFFGMGGLRQMPVLGAEPHTMTFELNEWKRFDRPGHYRLYVRSARIAQDGQGSRHASRVTSNLLELDVEPTSPEQSARALAAATALIDRAGGDEERSKSARLLRFLGTEAAALEMVRRLRGDGYADSQYHFGLVGSPHRAAVVRAMEARLDDDSPVTPGFLHTLALLRDKMDDPASPYQVERRLAVTDGYAARLAASLAKRSPSSRAVVVATVLDLGWQRAKDPPPYVAGALAMIPGVLRDLPPATMSTLLEHRWAKIKGPAMVPVLRALHDDPATTPDNRESALHRLLELDPSAGRVRVLAHLHTGEPPLGVLSARTLGALPDATLPELDAPLAARLEKDASPPIVAAIARYATAAPLARVRAVYARHATEWASDVEGHFLGYFLRVDPALGARAAGAVLAAKRSGAGRVLATAAEDRMTPDLEKVLIAALDAADTSTATDAAATLARHGSAAAAPALWRRLTRFHAEWKDREADLRYSVVDRTRNMDARQIESSLWNALATGRGWLLDKAAFDRLGSLLVTPGEKEQAAYRADHLHSPIQLGVHRTEGGELRITVAQYELDTFPALEAKLSQFPRGTAFRWHAWAEDPADFPRVKRALDQRGLTIER